MKVHCSDHLTCATVDAEPPFDAFNIVLPHTRMQFTDSGIRALQLL